VNETVEFLRTPLHKAAKFGHLEVVELLVNRGANLNAADGNGRVPYNEARKFTKVFKFLLSRMDETTKKNEMGFSIYQAVGEIVHRSRKSIDPELFRREFAAQLCNKRHRENDHIIPDDSDSGSDSDSEKEWVSAASDSDY